MTDIKTTGNANVRTSPDKSNNSNVMAVVPGGKIFTAESYNDWFELSVYIHKSVVVILPPINPDPDSVPYRSQWDPDADNRTADCGQTCCAALCAYKGIRVQVNDLRFQSQPTGISSSKDLIANFKSVGLEAERKLYSPGTLPEVNSICLVNYGGFLRDNVQDKNYRGWHWLIYLGTDGTDVIVHDPDYWGSRRMEGAFKRYSLDEWNNAFIVYPGSIMLDTVKLK